MNNCRSRIGVRLKLIIILSAVLSLQLPSPCSAKRYPDKKSSFSPLTTIIKSLSITRPTIVINLDDFKKSSDRKTDDNNFVQYLKFLPTIKQGKISGLRFVLLSKINKWQLVLNNLKLITNDCQPKKGSRWQVTGTYEFQHAAFKASGTISMELELDSEENNFHGRGKLKMSGKSAGHSYVFSLPFVINENLLMKAKLSLDGQEPVTSKIQLVFPSPDHPSWKAACSGELRDLASLAAMLQAYKPSVERLLPKNGRLFYQLNFAGRGMFLRPPYDAKLALRVPKMQFQSANSDIAIEDAGFILEAGLSVPKDGPGSLKISTSLHGGPFLWHNYFWDLSGWKAGGMIECVLPFHNGFPAWDAGISFSGNITADPLWSGTLKGSWSPEKGKLAFKGQRMDISKMLKIIMPEFLEARPRILSELAAAGNYQLSATMERKGRTITITGGNLSVNGRTVGSKNYGHVDDLEILMPLAGLTWDGKTKKLRVGRQAAPIRVKIGSITGPYLQAKAQTIPVDWGTEGLSIQTDIEVVAIGCPIKISNFNLHHPLAKKERRLDFQLMVKPASLAAQVPELPVPAKIVGLINEISHHVRAELALSLVGNQLETRGRIKFPLFSGQVKIENIQVRRLFSPSRVIALDLEAKKLNLQEVTALIEAGSATGIIDVSLKNLEISYGQPSKFDLEIRSVKTAGVPQKISVEAIENLSMISSGNSSGQTLLNVGINRFFSHYRYGKIGLYCRLRDDVFQLRGLIHEGDREYVVKRGFLTGIDVINYNPDNRISFRDMRERVLRIFQKK